jgi:hypothetical protein
MDKKTNRRMMNVLWVGIGSVVFLGLAIRMIIRAVGLAWFHSPR